MVCSPHTGCRGHWQGSPRQLEIAPRLGQLPFALYIPGGSPLPCLPFLMPWKLPESMVTTLMLPLPRCPCSGISMELLLEGP